MPFMSFSEMECTQRREKETREAEKGGQMKAQFQIQGKWVSADAVLPLTERRKVERRKVERRQGEKRNVRTGR